MHKIRATIAVAAVGFGFAAREITDSGYRFLIYAIAILVVGIQNIVEFKPDKRIDKIRKVNVDELFDGFFKNAAKTVRKGQRLPFRVNIMVKRRNLFLQRQLRMVYCYGFARTDPDWGLRWPYGCGLCWDVMRSSKPGWWSRSDDNNEIYRVPALVQQALDKVHAVISIPIRSQHVSDNQPDRKVHAVLNIDALSETAASDLEVEWQNLQADNNKKLVDLAMALALYF